MDKAQSKFINTASKMNDALFEILQTKDFKDISISEICQKAKVNRSTFYAHYDNTFDLLEETQKNFIKKFFSVYKLNAKDITGLSQEDSNFITAEYLIPYLRFIKQNKKLYKVYMENLNVFKSELIFEQMLEIAFLPILKKFSVNDQTLVEYMAHYYLTGITAIIMQWISRDCADDMRYICEIIILCVRPKNY